VFGHFLAAKGPRQRDRAACLGELPDSCDERTRVRRCEEAAVDPGDYRSDDSGTDPTVLPYLELASRFDQRVDQLTSEVARQPDEAAKESCVDLMVGLSVGAEAMRALHRGDAATGAAHLATAVQLLKQVTPGTIQLPPDTSESHSGLTE
jgi:hypothetical protein